MAARDELFGRTIRIAAVAAAVCLVATFALGFADPAGRTFRLYPAVLGLCAVQALAYALWRRREIDEIWRVSERSREGFGYRYHLVPIGVGVGLSLFALLIALIASLGLSMKIAWLCSGLTALLCLGFLLPTTIRLTRHVLAILWARLAGAPRESSTYAWQGPIVSGSVRRGRTYTATTRQVTQTSTDSSGRQRQVQVNQTIWDWRESIAAPEKLVIQVGETKLPIRLDQAVGFSLVRRHSPAGIQEWIDEGMSLVVAQARYLAPKNRGVEGQLQRPLRFVAAKGPATRAAVLAWLAQLGITAAFVGFLLLGGALAWVNPALPWYSVALRVMKAVEAPVNAGDSCALRLGLLPTAIFGQVDRSPLPAYGWLGEGGAPAADETSAGPSVAAQLSALAQEAKRPGLNSEVHRGRCYLRLWCGGETLVGGFDAGGFDCEVELDAETGALQAVYGGDGDDTDGDPGWRFSADRFRLFAGGRQLEGWVVLP